MPKAGWRWLQKKREQIHRGGGCPSIWKSQYLCLPQDTVRGSQALDILKESWLKRICAPTSPKANSCAEKQGHLLDINGRTEDICYPRKCPKLWPEAAGVVGDKRTVKRAGMIDIWNISQLGMGGQACWPIRKEAGVGGRAENLSLRKVGFVSPSSLLLSKP